MSLSGRGLRVDVTLEKLDDRVPKVQDGSGDASANLSGKRTEPSSLRNGVQPGMRRASAAENESVPNFADRAFGGFCPLLFCV